MGIAAWIELLTLVLKFPSAVLAVARLFQKTPEEKHNELVGAIQREAENFANTGRPTWD